MYCSPVAGGEVSRPLILSIFPGVDLLGRWFQEVFPDACIVRGPDVLWGGDIRTFHVPPGIWWGIIGGPPCQFASRLRYLNPLAGAKEGNLIPEFERIVGEGQPAWWIMENVPPAPLPVVPGYIVRSYLLENRWFGDEQHRERRFSFGTRDGRELHFEPAIFEAPLREYAVTSSAARVPVRLVRDGHGGHHVKRALAAPNRAMSGEDSGRGQGYEKQITIAEACRLQGLPEDFLVDAPFTAHGRRQVIGNGVPRGLGIAVARAVKRAMEVAS